MKLIRCSIENFGGLSQYTIQFSPGITEIEEPNGFGKTTLAEFIRAMFYGFPRAGKTLEKNSRKKYLPWQGGKYGGSLVFQHMGKQYRIERTFGSTPRSDTFALYDAITHRKSQDFSENIGLELFELDADSFERSTYMPQMHDTSVLTTASIQAKLGDLVEDTNDINNFDKAMEALKAKRSFYIPFRGRGGSVAEAQMNISKLQDELNQAEALCPMLERTQEKMLELKQSRDARQKALDSVRGEIVHASQSAAQETLTKQYESLKKRQSSNTEMFHRLQKEFPKGFPTEAELDVIEPLYDRVVALESQMIRTKADEEAENLISEQRLKFSAGVPTAQDFADQQEKCREYISTESSLTNNGLSVYEEQQFAGLKTFFQAGVPDKAFIDHCQMTLEKLRQLQSQAGTQALSPEEEMQLKNLEIFFAAGVPSESELTEKQSNLKRAGMLRQENLQIAAMQTGTTQNSGKTIQKKKSLFVPVLLLGIVALGISVAMMVTQAYALGGICLGVGLIAGIAAVYLKLKQVVSKEISASRQGAASLNAEERERIYRNEQEASALEEMVLAFAARYISDERTLSEKLFEIQSKRTTLISLQNRQNAMCGNQENLREQLTALTEQLTDTLYPYFKTISDFDADLLTLRTNTIQFKDLLQKKQEAQALAGSMKAQAEKRRRAISAFLRPYYGDVHPENFSAALSQLQRDCDAYKHAEKMVLEKREQITVCEETLEAYTNRVKAISEKYQIALDLKNRAGFLNLRDTIRAYTDLVGQMKKDSAEMAAFCEEHRGILKSEFHKTTRSLEELKTMEKQLSAEISGLSEEILLTEQKIRLLQKQTETIPEKQDALENWKTSRSAEIRNSAILDTTMDFLQKARENLSDTYLGTLQQSFAAYMRRMTGESREHIFVGSDLNVQIERAGEARELSYFSAGQADMITLCMRLALIDALFKETKPFIILDDPFINLDDAHTKEALKLLRELGKDHQIIYLVCNSSRQIKA